MTSLDTNLTTDMLDDLWGDMVAGFAPKLNKIKKIEDFRLEAESCKLWLRDNHDSLSQLEVWQVAELIRSIFRFERTNNVISSVVEMALMELGHIPMSESESNVISIRSKVSKGIQN